MELITVWETELSKDVVVEGGREAARGPRSADFVSDLGRESLRVRYGVAKEVDIFPERNLKVNEQVRLGFSDGRAEDVQEPCLGAVRGWKAVGVVVGCEEEKSGPWKERSGD